MKRSSIRDAENVILALQDEIRRSAEARYDHRLHGLLLVAQGMSARETAHILGDAPRTVAYWVRRFEEEGLSGVVDAERPGRPKRLNEKQIAEIDIALRKRPLEFGLSGNLWDGKTLSAFIQKKWEVTLGVRQCQRLFRRLDFRLRKPRPVIAKADPELQQAVKKTPENGKKRRH
jgi:transposase